MADVAPIANYRIDAFKLYGGKTRKIRVDIADAITAAELELTLDAASTLTITVEDVGGALLRAGMFTRWAWGVETKTPEGKEKAWLAHGRPVDAVLDGLVFRLVNVSKEESKLILTFEDREVSWLRRHKGARKVARSKVSRARFVQMLVDEVTAGRIELVCPELRPLKTISAAGDKLTDAERRAGGYPGIDDDSELTVNGKAATDTQIDLMEQVMDVARSHDATDRAAIALVAACIAESGFNRRAKDDASGAKGILQLLTTATVPDPLDVQAVCTRLLLNGFGNEGGLISLERANADWSIGELAAHAKGRPDARIFDTRVAEARRIADSYGGGLIGSADTKGASAYEFARGKKENSWDAIGRLASEVGWRRFMRMGELWFISDVDLFQQAAVLKVVEGEDGVDWIDFDIDLFDRRAVAEVDVFARADRWAARPGEVVVVQGSGPADGRWLVARVRRSLVDASGAVEIKLRKPTPELKEPTLQEQLELAY
jgi:hypothetical protein